MSETRAETRVLPLFPTFVWYAQLPPGQTQLVNRSITARLDEMIGAAANTPTDRLLQSHQQLHEDTAFAPLLPHLDAAVKGALDFMKVRYEKFVISGCWANVASTGKSHDAHCHPNNFLSGVYYVAADSGGDSITFHDPRPQPNIFMPPTRELNHENAGKFTVHIKPGTMVLFPSWLIHSVVPNQSPQRRISVAFNIMFDQFAQTMSPPMWDGNL